MKPLSPPPPSIEDLFPFPLGPADPDIFSRALAWWCSEVGLDAAAFYRNAPAGKSLVAAVGSASFPTVLAASPPGGLTVQPIDGGDLVFHSASLCSSEVGEVGLATHLLSAILRIHQLRGDLKKQTFQAKYRGVELEALYEVGLAISSTLDLEKLWEDVLLRSVSLLDARRGAFYEACDGGFQLRSFIGGDAVPSIASGALTSSAQDASQEDGDTARDGRSALPGAEHALAMPIRNSGASRGLLVVGDKESRYGVGPFSSQDRQTLALFAYQAAIALENAHLHQQALEKERMEREMELAAQIQRQILPDRLPSTQGYEVFGWNRPARQVGGDYYDVLTLANGNLVLVVADVSGKGMPAALMVSTLHSALRLMLDQTGVKAELLERLNRHILDLSLPNKFITLLLVEIEPATGKLRYLNAGHNPGLLVGIDGGIERLKAGGLPLGLMPSSQYQLSELELGEGAVLCLYSDGITECASPDGDEFGEQRLSDFLLQNRDLALERLEREMVEACVLFARGEAQGDDQTVVLLRRCLSV